MVKLMSISAAAGLVSDEPDSEQTMLESDSGLPAGVFVTDAIRHADDRGYVSEIYHKDDPHGVDLVQWNVAYDVTSVMRGVHVHLRHTDYVAVMAGRYAVGVHDMRPDSPTRGLSAMLRLDADDGHRRVLIPPGVAHGFYCLSAGLLIYGMSHRWDPADDLSCQWNDPGHGLRFPATNPVQSPRDLAAGSYEAMMARYQERRI